MHCPRCGQQQVSEEIKFCSRCGFPLSIVSELLVHNGFLPQLADLEQRPKKMLSRTNGLKFGLAWFLILTFLLVPLFAIAGVEEMVVASAILGFVGGMLMMIFSVMFLPKEPKFYQNENALPAGAQPYPAQFSGQGASYQQSALPPQMSQPVDNYAPAGGSWKAPDTGELVQPGSVTDATTKLLKKE